jgi:hypothetical protein
MREKVYILRAIKLSLIRLLSRCYTVSHCLETEVKPLPKQPREEGTPLPRLHTSEQLHHDHASLTIIITPALDRHPIDNSSVK